MCFFFTILTRNRLKFLPKFHFFQTVLHYLSLLNSIVKRYFKMSNPLQVHFIVTVSFDFQESSFFDRFWKNSSLKSKLCLSWLNLCWKIQRKVSHNPTWYLIWSISRNSKWLLHASRYVRFNRYWQQMLKISMFSLTNFWVVPKILSLIFKTAKRDL